MNNIDIVLQFDNVHIVQDAKLAYSTERHLNNEIYIYMNDPHGANRKMAVRIFISMFDKQWCNVQEVLYSTRIG